MNIHLARDGSALGVFTEGEVAEGLKSGRFRSDDLAWREGMPAWTPLSTWPEFGAAIPSSPASGTSASSPSELPWEVAPGLKSLFRSAWLAVTHPEVLTNSRLGAGSVFAAAYLVVAILFIPALALVPMGAKAERVVVTKFAEEMVTQGNPQFVEIGQKVLEEMQKQESAGYGVMLCSGACLLVLYPLLCGLTGLLLWPGLRLVGAKVAFDRTLVAAILVGALVRLACFPLVLAVTLMSVPAPALGILAGLAVALLSFGLVCRAHGAALGTSGWRVFFAWVLLGTFFCLSCCCCITMISLLGIAAGGRG